jgi:membrane protein DedA with SNARE-associated domain
MKEALTSIVDGLSSPWAYVLIGVLALLESAAFVGLAVPGETAMILGGFLAAQGRVSLSILLPATIAGALVGDSIGYSLGRGGAEPLRRSRLGRRIGDARFAAAEAYLRRRGGLAVFSGRFVGFLRALVPFLAGAGRMPYGRFIVWNAAGAVVWAPLCVAIGFIAGDSYRLAAEYLGRAGLLLAALMTTLVALGLVWRHMRKAAAAG